MQALHLLALEPIAETLADPHSFGFRSKRSTADAIEQCVSDLNREVSLPAPALPVDGLEHASRLPGDLLDELPGDLLVGRARELAS